jgi:maltose-binding protein MalE
MKASTPNDPTQDATDNPSDEAIHLPRQWRDNGWTAQVIKNENDEGWAVAMYKAGQAEPALVGPWTMGRNKKDPKPLDTNAFNTLVKTAAEVIRRHEQHLEATLHPKITVGASGQRILVALDIVPDDDSPQATLSAFDETGELLARVPVSPGFKLNRASASAWIEGGLQRPK